MWHRARSFLAEPAPLPALALHPAYAWFVVGTVCVGSFMGQLDVSIVQLVLPTLETTFHARLSLVDWVSLAYLLALGAGLPIFGRLADMVGRKILYTGGFLLFITGSALCAVAPTLPLLIGARVFQAIGAGLLQANSVAIITKVAGARRLVPHGKGPARLRSGRGPRHPDRVRRGGPRGGRHLIAAGKRLITNRIDARRGELGTGIRRAGSERANSRYHGAKSRRYGPC